MLKSDIMNMINDFESETWKYDSTDELDSDMQYIYSIESELKNIDDSYIEQIYNKLIIFQKNYIISLLDGELVMRIKEKLEALGLGFKKN